MNDFGDLVTIMVLTFFIIVGVFTGVFITYKSLSYFIESLGVLQ